MVVTIQGVKIEYITIPEVKELFDRISQERELEYEQKLTYDYVKKFSKITAEEARKLRKELSERFPKVKESHITNIVNILPETVNDLKVILAKSFTLSEEELEEMMKIINKYRKEKK